MLSEMDMGTEELVLGSCNHDTTQIAKGKRTKRRVRPLSPCATAMTSSCSSGGGSFSSTTFEGTDQEEEDMANCLILLAQGRGGDDSDHKHHQQQLEHVHGVDVKTNSNMGSTKINFYVYECKTCNRTFPSFQALGGHRASHKKPKVIEGNRKSLIACDFEEAKQSHVRISLQLGCGNSNNRGGNKSKIHECSICGSEFTSGQALGGHMRRHRASNNNGAVHNAFDAGVEVKPRNVLELDLNLPAPEDDVRESKFQFPANQSSMVLSAAPALVGCHY
ncbi:zinc finger protein ZAT5 [Abrus precatorius]|uniref:Zinc finger protein ZAT5 n=1 Tax=Abrus precatorius TaxID=3816 RepID=A0A8B8KFJ3_ABRPR|nr:zinc finger protein ZAT5 [Abrus precatorius]